MIQTAKEAIDDDWDSTRTRSINQTAASIDESLENEKQKGVHNCEVRGEKPLQAFNPFTF